VIRRRVLFVDDERLLTAAVGDILSEHHDVVIASTAADAIRRVQEDGGFDVVLCDVQLTDGTALDVHAAYRAAWPGREHRLVLVTGGTDLPGVRALIDGGQPVLLKPFDPDELAVLIDRLASS